VKSLKRGQKVPFLIILTAMYNKRIITDIVEEVIDDLNVFIVDIMVGKGNRITVFIDSENGVSIDDCVFLSRHIESKLDREKEDFELDVSSAGIGYPFKVERQYLKNIGNNIEVILLDGKKYNGVLKSYNNGEIELEFSKKVMSEGKKKKQLITENRKLKLKDIKSTKQMLLF